MKRRCNSVRLGFWCVEDIRNQSEHWLCSMQTDGSDDDDDDASK